MATIQQESLSELGLWLHLFASELTEDFFAARTAWPGGQSQIRCVLFFRRAFRSGKYQRDAAYAFAIKQDFPYLRLTACLERSLDEVFTLLRCYGYDGETWLTLPRSVLHQHLTWQEEERLWNANQFNRNLLLPS